MTTYKTAKKLGITDAEHAGLIELANHLKGEVCVLPEQAIRGVGSDSSGRADVETILGFSMSIGAGVPIEDDVKYDCGCVACIGGHLSLRMQGIDITSQKFSISALKIADQYVDSFRGKEDHPLHDLFYPTEFIDFERWDLITPAIAAEAINNFLTTGSPDWSGLAEMHDINDDEED
ncbi:hypothetical protein [Methylobacterium sp. WL120]|uniref:hypothetical protein n=1 Tax=Methylobacterium sp. WL120 TaxID=2603887 RepID=UPI0011CCA26A|nr:hypothetical protein [Methylobacterium sp. WL120]TXM69669.1 hypothetical protein FV229_04810 [Methylobacterium sp. WL120]